MVQQLENRVASLDVQVIWFLISSSRTCYFYLVYGLSNNVLLLQNRDLWEVRVGQEASLREARGQLSCRDEEVGAC